MKMNEAYPDIYDEGYIHQFEHIPSQNLAAAAAAAAETQSSEKSSHHLTMEGKQPQKNYWGQNK